MRLEDEVEATELMDVDEADISSCRGDLLDEGSLCRESRPTSKSGRFQI